MLPLSDFLGKLNPLEKGNPSLGKELYLCLVISERKVKSCLWSLLPEEEKILAFGPTENWGGTNTEDLIVAADASIAAAITKLPEIEGKQPEKILLGLPDYWVEENKIVKSHQAVLQGVCQKLTLKPIGFAVIPEAIAHFLKKEEGGLPSIVLINLEETEIVVSLVIKGKFMGSKVVGKSDNLALDVEEGLLRFDCQEPLPSRLLLLNGETDLEEARQTLIAYPWLDASSKGLNFLQLPKVEVADAHFELLAVVSAGSRELSPPKEPLAKTSVITPEEEEVKEEEKIAKPIEEYPKEDFGFVEGSDVSLAQPMPKNQDQPEEPVEAEPPKNLPRIKFHLPSIGLASFFGNVIRRFPKKVILLPLLLIVLLGLIGFFSFWQLAQAEVTVLVRPQELDKEFEFTAQEKLTAVSLEKMSIPVRAMMADVSGKKSGPVVGKKIVGDKASGEIIVYNRTDQAKSIPKETIIKGPGGLKFTLAEKVEVASKTADLEQGVDKWGEARVPAVAAEIGAQYNLAKDSQFTFDSLPVASFLIKNPAAFSGGTSREIRAVVKEDRDNLQKALIKELQEKALSQVKDQLSAKDYLLTDSLTLKTKTDSFDHEIGDETETLSLEEKATFSVPVIRAEDFEVLAEKVISQIIPTGFQREKEKEQKSFVLKDGAKGIYLAGLKLEFLPQIETDKIPALLKAKRVSRGEAIIKELNNNTEGIDIKMRPFFFSILHFLPLQEKNIRVTVAKL